MRDYFDLFFVFILVYDLVDIEFLCEIGEEGNMTIFDTHFNVLEGFG